MAHIKSRKHAPAQAARLSHCATAALTLLALPAAVLAQTTDTAAQQTTLPAVKAKAQEETPFKADTASSPKFTQPLVDTPQTITVIKKELLKQQGATNLAEALRNVPGVTLQLGENGNTQTGDSIFMRGFDTSASIFVDGIRDLGSISRDTFNLEQIEVVKGPSGSDNGRGASSGYVNLVSKAPQTERFASGSVSVGTQNRSRVTVDLNQPFESPIAGTAFRLNVMGQDYGVPGRDEVKNKRWGVAPSLAFGLGTPTKTTLSYLHIEQRNTPDGGVSTFGMPGYGYNPGNPSATPPVLPQTPGAAVDPENYYGLNGDHDNVVLDMFTAGIEHTLAPGYVLRNTSRLGRTSQDLLVTGVNTVFTNTGSSPGVVTGDPSTWQIARSRQAKLQENQILTNQTNLNAEIGSGFVKHSLSTGFEFIYERQNTRTPTTVTSSATVPGNGNLYNPNQGDTMARPVDNGVYARGSTLTAALYAFDTIKLGESWMLNGGLRWDKFYTETNGSSRSNAGVLTQNEPQSLTDDLLSWKLGALFKPAQNGSVYVSASSSKQPPGGNNFNLVAQGATPNQANTSMKPQEGRNYELGTKWDLLDGKLALTGAIYRSENLNELVNDGGSPAIYSQIGKRRVDGIELGTVGQITPALNLSAGLALMDSEIVQGTPAQTGGVIVFSPKVTFTSWLSYKLPAGLTFGGGVRYVDTQARSSNVSPSATGLNTIDDYWVADAMVSYEVNKNLTLQLNLNNLLDEEYVGSINSGGSRYRPGEARNALLTANVTF